MTVLLMKIRKFEFEARIFVSFGLVILVCALSFTTFASRPSLTVALGAAAGIPAPTARILGDLAAAAAMALASFLRIWAGSTLTSKRMMSFAVNTDELCLSGPYGVIRNPIYLADLIAFSGFALILPPIGLLLPVFLVLHYTQLISYEELSLRKEFGPRYAEYAKTVPQLIPNPASLRRIRAALRGFAVTRDGFRHNALYFLFIPGFLVAAVTGKLLWAAAVGLPAVIDWAIVHTKVGIAKDKAKPTAKKRIFADVLYANCWEDPRLDRAAFRIQPSDVILSITSGGCNVLTFLLDDPRKVVAVDVNPHQNHLLQLKIAAFRKLSHRRLLEFFGVRPSAERLKLYRDRLRPCLSAAAGEFWDARPKKIERGLIHAGRYERYMRLLRRTVIVFSGKRRIVEKMFELEDPSSRERLYREGWQDLRWAFLTRVMLCRRLNSILFDKTFFSYLDRNFSFGRHFAAKFEHALVRLPIQDNYFLSYILFGRFFNENHLPPYLRRENFQAIRDRLDRVEIVTDNCAAYLKSLEDSSISKFSFSNIFEWMAPEVFESILRETVRVARDGAILTYRNLLVFRERPASLSRNIRPRKDLATPLKETDLSFIYDNYVVEQVEKG